MKTSFLPASYACNLLLACSLLCSSCFSYKLATEAQGATDNNPQNQAKAYSLFWGLANKPQVIHTPICDSMGVNGVAMVKWKTSFGNALVTFVTLGIYCPTRVYWNCSKPCQQVQGL